MLCIYKFYYKEKLIKNHRTMFGQFQHFSQEDSKGLFTFYREQAEKEQQIRRMKKERRLARIRQQEQQKRKDQQQQAMKQTHQHKQQKEIQPKQDAPKIEHKTEKQRKILYEPKNRRQKYNHQQLGASVVVVNSKQLSNRIEHAQKSLEQKSSLRKIQQLINPHNNNRYFLQNREMPSSFGRVSLEKMMVKPENNQSEQIEKEKKSAIKPSYFNSCGGVEEQKKYIPTFSYDKLPELLRSRPAHSQIILPKRYKSKKIETALKSNNSELIRQIRESLRQESMLQKISYIDANTGIAGNEYAGYEKQYENRLNSQLDAKQRRLIDILRNSSNTRKKKYL